MIVLIILAVLFFWVFIYKNYFRDDLFVFFSYLTLVFFLVSIFLFTRFPFSPDSYSYFDISNHMFLDFGRINTVRQYVVPTQLNISFPPLLPFFIAIINLVFNLGMLSGVILNLYVALITVILIDVFFRKLSIKPVYAVTISYLLIFNVYYLNELLAARAIPLNLLLFTIILFLFTNIFSNTKLVSSILVIGVLNGLMVLNRFDHIFTLFVINVYLLFLLLKIKKIKYYFVFTLSFAITIFPWVAYSFINFGTFFISDNSSTLTLVYPIGPRRFQSGNFENPDIFNSLLYWLKSLIFVRAPRILIGIFRLGFGSFPTVVFILISTMSILLSSIKKRNWYQLLKHPIIAVLVYTVFRTSLFLLVGYEDSRYHLETLLLFSIMVVVFLNYHEKDSIDLRGLSQYLVLSSILFTAGFYVQSNINLMSITSLSLLASRNLSENINLLSHEENEINRYFHEKSSENITILNLSQTVNSFRFGALTDFNILSTPRISESDYEGFLEFPKRFHFDYVIFDNESIEEYLSLMDLEVEYLIEIGDLFLAKVNP